MVCESFYIISGVIKGIMVMHSFVRKRALKGLSWFTLLTLLLPGISGAAGSPEMKVRQIGVIVYADPFLKSYEGLRAGLQNEGYKLDEEIIFKVHSVNGNTAKVAQLVREFSVDKVDLIYTVTTSVTQAVKACISENRINIPVVFTVVADPVGSKIVSSLRHPGTNITGISHVSKELLPQRLLLFKKAFPKIKRVAVFYDPDEEVSKSSFDQRYIHQAAQDSGVTMVVSRVHDRKELQDACQRFTVADIDSIFMLPDALSVASFKDFLQLSQRLKIPFMVIDNMLLQRGGVMGYSPDFFAVGVQAANLVEQVFKGISPGDIAVQNPEKVKLVVSLKEARKLGLEVSEEVLLQADEVLR